MLRSLKHLHMERFVVSRQYFDRASFVGDEICVTLLFNVNLLMKGINL